LALLGGALLSALSLSLEGCRTTTICNSAECRAGDSDVAGDSAAGLSQPSAAAGGRGAQSEGGSSGFDGEGSAGEGGGGMGGMGGAGGEPEPGVACGINLADCDGSRLTPCETNITWMARHCGGCGMACEGLCLGGKCEAAVEIMKGWPLAMVASSSTGFVLINELQKHSVLKVDGAIATVYLDDVTDALKLSISNDRVYFFDYYADEQLKSARLDGSDFLKEQVTSLTSVGATVQGAYYVSESYDESTSEYSSVLMFRASGASSWKKLFEGPSGRILSSSAYGLVVARYDQEDDEAPPSLDLYVGENATALGLAPPHLEEVAVTEDAVVVLTRDDASYRLWWLPHDGSKRTHYEITGPDNYETQLIVDGDYVVLFFDEDGKRFIQRFTSSGAELSRSGVSGYSGTVYVDRYYLWHGVWDDALSARFLRSPRLDFEL
jgi:hypothetical protein